MDTGDFGPRGRGGGNGMLLPVQESDAAPGPSETCCTISVSPLLRELLLKVAGFPELYAQGGEKTAVVNCRIAR